MLHEHEERFSMKRYVIRRLLLILPTLLGVSIAIFSMLHLIPGDPVYSLVKDSKAAVDIDEIRHQLGLDLPLYIQYWRFLSKAIHGDLGQAIFIQRSVTKVILENLPYTLRLVVLGTVLELVFGLFFGIVAALNVDSWIDSAITAVAVSGLAIPEFWLALLVILVFRVKLDWFPIFGPESPTILLLPAFVIGFRGGGVLSRMVRSTLLEVLNQDYIRTARAKGLTEGVVIIRHALKNALIPVVTLIGLRFGGKLGGTMVVEVIFARRGIGDLAVNAILQRDYPLAQGTVLFVSVAYVLINLIVDLVYAYLDPRIRYD
jgi:ABC-type dipeptide/oligopeptide/nickel transport system permease component